MSNIESLLPPDFHPGKPVEERVAILVQLYQAVTNVLKLKGGEDTPQQQDPRVEYMVKDLLKHYGKVLHITADYVMEFKILANKMFAEGLNPTMEEVVRKL